MPALPSGVRGAVITGWGTALPQGAHQPRSRADGRDVRRVDRRTDRHPPAPRRRHHHRHVDRVGSRRARHVGRRPPRDRCAGAGHDDTRHAMGYGRHRAERARPALRRVRRQRGVLGFRLRASHRARHDRHGRPQGVADRHRLVVANHRLGGPQHRGVVRRRIGCRGARSRRRPWPAPRVGSRRRRLARSVAVGRGRWVHPHGGQRGLPSRRAHHGRLGDQVDRTMPASRPTTSRWWSPTRPTSASSRPRASASVSPWSAPPPSCTTPATRRRRRSRWPLATRSTTAASPRAIWCCWSVSVADDRRQRSVALGRRCPPAGLRERVV